MDNYNIKKNNEELSGEAFDYFMLSFIKNRDELNNWKDKVVLGFYSQQGEGGVFGNSTIKVGSFGTFFTPEDTPFGLATIIE